MPRMTKLELRLFRRMLINGPPFSSKTTGCLLLPPPRHFLVVPGELGLSSLPADDPETHVYWWQREPGKPINYAQEYREVIQTADEILQGKHGPVTSLIIDGLHKFAELAMYALGWTPETLDSDSGSRQYPKYYAHIGNFLSRITASDVPYFAATCYDGREQAEDATGGRIKGQVTIWPEMPGKLAKLILGNFPVTFHSERRPGNPEDRYFWRLRPSGQVQGAGMHVPPSMLKHFPTEVEIKLDKATGKLSGGWQDIEAVLARLSAPQSAPAAQEVRTP